MSTVEQAPGYVYALYNVDGEIVYIGSTANPKRRLQEHQSIAPWWHKVAGYKTFRVGSVAEARRRESAAINAVRPAFNKALSNGLSLHGARSARTDRLTTGDPEFLPGSTVPSEAIYVRSQRAI